MGRIRIGAASLGSQILVLGIALLIAGCGASFDSGVASPTPTQSAAAIASASPSASATPTPSASACVSPSTQATYTLPGARVLAGDLQVKDQVVGTGTKAQVGNTIKVDYSGSLTDGTVFDSTAANNKGNPVSLTLAPGKVIAGWVEGIPGMRVGGTRELVIPAALGYACQSVSTIPANSTLIFTVKLVSVS